MANEKQKVISNIIESHLMKMVAMRTSGVKQ